MMQKLSLALKPTNYLRGMVAIGCLMMNSPAYACSPSVQYMSLPLAMKIKSDDFFIGKVVDVDADEVTFEVMAVSSTDKDKNVGDKIDMKRGETASTCGRKEFVVGETWLYDGNDISFGPSQKLGPSDLKDGYDLAIVKENLVRRVEPDYKEPVQPLKTDLPVPGTYSFSEECDKDSQANGYMSADYSLKISEADNVSKNYKVDILMNICRGGHICEFSGEAPAYGYGEIVLPMLGKDGQKIEGCNVIVQQLSGINDWPRLKAGEAKVIVNDPRCQQHLQCGSNTYLDSPVLQHQSK